MKSKESHNLDVMHLGCCTGCGGTHLLPTSPATQSPPTQEGESVLSSVTEDHAKEIIKAGYPAFFKSGNWHLTDESDALKEPCKKLLCKTKSFCFWFFNDKIDIDFNGGGIEATFDDINFDVRYQCYIKAAELGYNIPGLRRTQQESKEGVEDWISVEKIEVLCKNAFHDSRTIYKGIKCDDWWAEFKLLNDIK